MNVLSARDSLEHRILVVTNGPLTTEPPMFLLQDNVLEYRPGYSFEESPTFPSKSDLQKYSVVVVGRKDALNESVMKDNVSVPVILFQPTLPPPSVCDELIQRYNLYAVGTFSLDALLKEAILDKERVKQYLAFFRQSVSFLKSLPVPRFRSAVEKARGLSEKLASIPDVTETTIAPWRQVVEGAALYHQQDEETRRSYGPILARRARLLLDMLAEFLPPGKIYRPGEGEGTEDPMVQPRGANNFDFSVLREIFPKRNVTSKQIATQMYDDVLYISRLFPRVGEESSFGIQTRRMFYPLHFSEQGVESDTSLLIMEWVPGVPLNDVLEHLNFAYQHASKKKPVSKRIDVLRRALVSKMVRDTALYVKHVTEAKQIPHVRKPTSDEVIDDYVARVKDLPELFARHSRADFHETDYAAWKESMGVFRLLDFPPGSIVRTRDASLGNAIVRVDSPNDIKAYLAEFTYRESTDLKEGRRTHDVVNRSAIERKFFSIDFGARYGHILEDLAHIVSAADLHIYHHASSGRKLLDPKMMEEIKSLRAEYFKTMGGFVNSREEAAYDNQGLMLMILYRSLRKFQLNFGYWSRLHQEHGAGRVYNTDSFKQRKKRIVRHMKHYSALAQAANMDISFHLMSALSSEEKAEYDSLKTHVLAAVKDDKFGQIVDLKEYRESSSQVKSLTQFALMTHVLNKVDIEFGRAERERYSPLKNPGEK